MNNEGFDLEERTALFGEKVIEFCKNMEVNTITTPLIKQIVRSSTSIGANYCEANSASSKRDFKNKIHTCKKEAQETKHWFRMLAKASPKCEREAKVLWEECQEPTLIFGKIISSLRKSKLNRNS